MHHLVNSIRRAVRAFGREVRRDDGVIALVIAIALIAAAAALIAASARQNKEAEVRRLSANATSVKTLRQSVIAYYLNGNNKLPCPDSASTPTGAAGGETSGACNDNVGVVPWLALGLSEEDVIDAYGNYFTYVVTADADSRAVCKTITNEYDNSSEFTGTINAVSDTESLLTSQSTGEGSAFYYAFISHGPNGLGAIARGGTLRAQPSSTAETQNCLGANSNCSAPAITTPTTIYTGPKNTDTSDYFDDIVYLGSRAELTEMCESKTPGQKANAFVNETFDSTAVGSLPSTLTNRSGTADSGNGDGTVQVVAGTGTNRLLEFNGGSSNLDTALVEVAGNYNPAARPLFISFQWTPTVLDGGEAGLSVATRAALADRDANTANNEDIFNGTTDYGLTFRFYDDGVSTDADTSTSSHHIYLCDNIEAACDSGTRLAASGAFSLVLNRTYKFEVYDDGNQVWARITDTAAGSNTATLSLTTIPLAQQDLEGANSIFLINHIQSNSRVDDLLIGRGAMALETAGGSDYASATASEFDLPGAGSGDLTIEAAINPDALPAGSAEAALVSKWYTDGTTSGASPNVAYRMYLTASGLTLSVVGDTTGGGVYDSESFAFGYKPVADKWTHVAVVYNHTAQTASLYVDGELSSSLRSSKFGTRGVIHIATAAPLTIGNERSTSSTTGTHGFDGQITDVRVWSTARTSSEIFANYRRRIRLTASQSGLIGNFTFDRDTDTTFGALTTAPTAAGTATTSASLVNSPVFAGILQTFYPPFADEICGPDISGTPGKIVNTYQCDFRDAVADNGEITVPNNLGGVYVKTWGGGGGAYDFGSYESNGGGAGFAGGYLRRIGSPATAISGLMLTVTVGQGGAASTDDNNGAGGGGASGIWRDTDLDDVADSGTDYVGIAAGGGGGASFGDDNLTAQNGPDCTTIGSCGPGGIGGGPYNFTNLGTDQTARAADPDAATVRCGGRGGDSGNVTNNNPPDLSGDNTCSLGGSSPSATRGGGDTVGGTGGSGGASILGAGGAGYDGSGFEIGAGGAGGGVFANDLSLGGGEAGGYDATTGIVITGGGDANGSGFGGGGGAGFAETNSRGVIGSEGAVPAPGGSSDTDYAPSYCNSGANCSVTAGRGGEPNGTTAGRQGAVILRW